METRVPASKYNLKRLGGVSLLSLLLVAAAVFVYLSRKLPDATSEIYHFAGTELVFKLGLGHPQTGQMIIDHFIDGNALLSSGPVALLAENHDVLRYDWQVSNTRQEAVFFWRQKGSTHEISRVNLNVAGKHLVNLSAHPEWQGEIIEFGFMVGDETIAIGPLAFEPDSLGLRLQMMWQGWVTFEEWSQQSVHFLQGGDYTQVIPLPLLIIAWLVFGVVLVWLDSRIQGRNNSGQLLAHAGLLLLIAWMLLDVRWTINNLRQTKLSLQSWLQADAQKLSIDTLDGGIFQYVQRLKNEVLGDQPARILIVGDEDTAEYYPLRAKYHLLPHSVNVAGRFAKKLAPQSLDFVIFFGQAANIAKVPGWDSSWQRSLVQIDSGQWGVVYRVE
jgi:hypothetical protein